MIDQGIVHLKQSLPGFRNTRAAGCRSTIAWSHRICRVDHSGEAAKVGLKMRPTQLIIFGSPKAGTPPMVASPTLAIDLPLKALVWEDADGKVWVSYNSPEFLKRRHDIPDELVKNVAVIGPLLQSVVA